MKRLFPILLFIPSLALATSTLTTHYSLEKPTDGSTSWGSAIRDSFDTIDTELNVNATAVSDHVDDAVGRQSLLDGPVPSVSKQQGLAFRIEHRRARAALGVACPQAQPDATAEQGDEFTVEFVDLLARFQECRRHLRKGLGLCLT